MDLDPWDGRTHGARPWDTEIRRERAGERETPSEAARAAAWAHLREQLAVGHDWIDQGEGGEVAPFAAWYSARIAAWSISTFCCALWESSCADELHQALIARIHAYQDREKRTGQGVANPRR